MAANIVIPDCDCCKCVELTLLNTPSCTQSSTTIKMYGWTDEANGTVIKIGTTCWEITDNDVSNCAGALPKLGATGTCPTDCTEDPLPGCWYLSACTDETPNPLITDTDMSAYFNKVVDIAGGNDPQCYQVVAQIPCDGTEQAVTVHNDYDNCEDCYGQACCTCGDCQFEDDSDPSADSKVDWMDWVYDFTAGKTPGVIRATDMTQTATCGEWEGTWNSTDDNTPVACPGTEGSDDPQSGNLKIRWNCTDNKWEVNYDEAGYVDAFPAGDFPGHVPSCCGNAETNGCEDALGVYRNTVLTVKMDACCATAPAP